VAKKKVKKKKKAVKKAVKKKKPLFSRDLNNLAKLTAIQLVGIIVVEIITVLLVAAGLLPPTLKITQMGIEILEINTVFLVVAGLVFVLVAAFWTALLVETTDIIEIEDIDFNF